MQQNDAPLGLHPLVWWLISVVLVGILLNLVSSYLRDYTDAAFSRVSSWWATRSEKRRGRLRTIVDLLVNNDAEYIRSDTKLLLLWMKFFSWMILAFLVLTAGNIVGLGNNGIRFASIALGAMALVLSLGNFLQIMVLADAVRLAQVERELSRRTFKLKVRPRWITGLTENVQDYFLRETGTKYSREVVEQSLQEWLESRFDRTLETLGEVITAPHEPTSMEFRALLEKNAAAHRTHGGV